LREQTRRPRTRKSRPHTLLQTSWDFSAHQQANATQSFFAKSSGRHEVYSLSISSEALELRVGLCNFTFPAPAWRNWQTRWTQNPVIARSCGFEPLRRQTLRSAITKSAGKDCASVHSELALSDVLPSIFYRAHSRRSIRSRTNRISAGCVPPGKHLGNRWSTSPACGGSD